MKYLISISYDGSKYYGLQKLKGKKTVQGELETVLSKLNQSPVSVKASGRTDRGVHALDQKCHFELNKKITPYRLRYYINRMTSKNLYVKDCTIIENEGFHARFSVKSKTYSYLINTGEYDAIQNDYLYNFNKDLDVAIMKECANAFIGGHNFKAFVIGPHKTYESIIDDVKISKNNNIISIEIKGQAFYTYMVRNIVSTLILAGEGKIDKNTIDGMLSAEKKLIEYAPAPANGLYLKKVEY